MPPRKTGEYAPALPDIPLVYFTDRSQWTDFKRALNNCGLTWNLPDWMMTITYKGADWQAIADTKRAQLEELFAAPVRETENKKYEVLKTSNEFLKILGYPKSMGEYIQTSVSFCNLRTLEYEPDHKLPARQKFWTWIVNSLHGPSTTPGPYHYLTKQMPMYDIAYLFKKLFSLLEVVTICSLDDEVFGVTHLDFDSTKQDFFAYVEDLRRAMRRLQDLNDRLPEEGKVLLSDAYLRTRLIRAARQIPIYKSLIDQLITEPPEKWSTISSEDLCKKFEAVRAHDASFVPKRFISISSTENDVVAANMVKNNTHAKKPKERTNKQEKTCNEFRKTGQCLRLKCPFLHKPSDPTPEQKSVAAPTPPIPPSQSKEKKPQTCQKCAAQDHTAKDCKYVGKCVHCGRNGHNEEACFTKKSGGPKVMSAEDGRVASLNFLRVCTPTPPQLNVLTVDTPTPPVCSMSVKTGDTVCERFYADTGANRSIHPNMKSSSNFYRTTIDINTANGPKTMQSEGVGKMKLYTPGGLPMPGFNDVIFTKQASEKLASVGELCDQGLVCVFDKEKMTMYKSDDFQTVGKIFTQDSRDPLSKLYPLSLYRKVGERESRSIAYSALSLIECKQENKIETKQIEYIEKLPDVITTVGDKLPTSLLAKTYVKQGLSDLDRYHAKLGDIGIKYMKRCLPSLKIPKQYRCEFCIDGKIHKFGHHPAPSGVRMDYAPGVCIHTDHSGPYAQSVNGYRYSQLYLDRGSGYLWAIRQKKKDNHYEDTPKIFIDARALSGKRVQILQTDGDGVFCGKKTTEMLENYKVRHEWSAPYDSDTNSFIERARRTIFEGVSTSLLRSGAPANFWGDAENHKIFTMNVLPIIPDKENKGKFVSRKNLLEGSSRPFDLNRLMAFGTATTCYIPVEKRKNGKEPGQRRSFQGVLVGYCDGMPAYRIWDLSDKNVKQVSYHFTICHEGYYPFRDKTNWPPEMKNSPTNFSPIMGGVLTLTEWKKYGFDPEEAGEILSRAPDLLIDFPEPIPKPAPLPVDVEPYVVVERKLEPPVDLPILPIEEKKDLPTVPPEDPDELLSIRQYREKLRSKVSYLKTDLPNLNLSDPFEKPICVPPPKTILEAKLSPWWPQYDAATRVEYDGHVKSGTWEIVPLENVPKGKNILRGKWVFDDKRGENGKITKFKARFVAMGFTQKYGEDYTHTFAGVVVSKSFRVMLAMLCESPTHEFEHWDVKMAFTQAPLEEKLYMHQPEGFENDHLKKFGKNCPTTMNQKKYVCLLKKSLYGLKQAAHNWQLFLSDLFREVGFLSFRSDPCVYYFREETAWCLCSTHVDDIFVLFNYEGKILRDKLFQKFSSRVEIDNLGPISWALKTHILRDRKNGIVKISQEQYTTELLKKKNIPMASGKFQSPSAENSQALDEPVDDELKKGFQSDIGAFWWLAQVSRPDIYYAVHTCAKMVNKPNKILGQRLQRIFNYLSHSPSLGIVYRHQPNAPLLSGYVDAAFAEENQISRIGYFYLFHGNLVSWTSENPSRIMTSSTEAECRGLVHIAKENIWHRHFHQELGLFPISEPTIVFEDNTAAISMSTNSGVPHKRSKHFGIEWAFFRECVELEEIKPVHLSTNEQVADMLTKHLPLSKFVYFRDIIMGRAELQMHFSLVVKITHSIVGDVNPPASYLDHLSSHDGKLEVVPNGLVGRG